MRLQYEDLFSCRASAHAFYESVLNVDVVVHHLLAARARIHSEVHRLHRDSPVSQERVHLVLDSKNRLEKDLEPFH